MKIEIPIRHYKYLKMLVRAEVYPNEEIAALYAFEQGLMEIESDAETGVKDYLNQELLDGKQMTVYVPDHIKFSYNLVKFSELYNESKSLTSTNILLKGLFDRYLELKDCKLYGSDKEFRNEVDMMPHSAWYDIEEDLDLNLDKE